MKRRKDNNIPFLGAMLIICLLLVAFTSAKVTDDPYQLRNSTHETK